MSFDKSFMNSDDDNDENEFSHENSHFYSGREGIIFLIDCRKDMFIKNIKNFKEENKFHEAEDNFYSGFVFALECCKETMLKKIKFSENSLISVIFFGVEKGDANRKHITEFQPLTISSASKIKDLHEIVLSESHQDFKNKYGHSDSGYLIDALSASLFSFSMCSVKLALKRILLFTHDDNPDEGYPNKQHQIRRRANDLSEAGVDLDLLPIGSNFNPRLFYQEMLQIVKKEDYDIPTRLDCLNDAMEIIERETHNKRTLSRIKFHLGDQVVLGVGVYRFTCKKQQYTKKALLSRETNEPLRSVRELLDVDTGDKLRPYQVVKTTNVGGKNVAFSNDELLKMRKVFEPGMILLGFKPKNFWRVQYHCCQPFFIFPDESIVQGSRQLFVALWNRCVARNVVALCVFTPRRGTRPKYVVLDPQEEIFDEKDHQEMPAGFHVFVLPFARMFGDIPVEETRIDPNLDEMVFAKKLVKKLKIRKFHQDFFENPSLSKLWVSLEAVALQHADARPFEDTTLIHHEKLQGRLRDLAVEFIEIFEQESSSSGAMKRKAGDTSKIISVIKIPKKAEFIDLATQKKIDKLTVPQLKEILKLVPRVHVSGSKKSDLIKLVYKNINTIKNNFE